MSNLLCKILGHKIEKGSVNTKRFYARCKRCWTGLKVSYDMTYGDTYITGDYGNQRTFCWCDCGNELCSSNSYIDLQNDINRFEYYKCSKCQQESKWDFDCIVPIRIYPDNYYCNCGCEIAKMVNNVSICADCNKPNKC